MGGLSTKMDIFFNFMQINMGHSGIIAVEDLGQLFKSRSTSFDVEEIHEKQLDKDPNLVKY